MRNVHDWSEADIKFSIMQWQTRFVLRAEQAGLEQAFKYDVMDFTNADELRARVNPDFIADIKNRFDEMRVTWGKVLK